MQSLCIGTIPRRVMMRFDRKEALCLSKEEINIWLATKTLFWGWINSYNSREGKGRGGLQLHGGGLFISQLHKGILDTKLFWNSGRAEFRKGWPTSYLNQNFPECLTEIQIPTPNLRPAEPKTLEDGNWEPIVLTVRHWFSNFHVHWSVKMPGFWGWGVRKEETPK